MIATAEASQLMLDGSIALSRVSENGIRIDVDYLNKTIDRVSNRIKKLESEFCKSDIFQEWKKHYGSKTKLSNSNQLATVLFDRMGFEGGETTEKSGRWKKGAETLEKIDHPAIQNYIEVGKLRKLRSTNLLGIKNELAGEFIHPNFNLHIARTYRSSSSNPNFQNFPKRDEMLKKLIRRCFIPRENHVLIEVDISGAEVRVAACYNQDPVLIEYILDKTKDMHRDMAAELYKCQQDQVSKAMRHCGKNMFVFPEFYGSFYKLCAVDLWNAIDESDLKIGDVNLKKWLAQNGIKRLGKCAFDEDPARGTFEHHVQKVERSFWQDRFNVYSQWKKDWYDQYLKKGGFLTHTGFWIEGIMSRKDVINYPIQGSAFHCLLWSLIQVVKKMSKQKWRSKVIGQIHDSIVADVHIKEVDRYLDLVKTVMLDKLLKHYKWLIVPMEIEAEACSVGETWNDVKEIEL